MSGNAKKILIATAAVALLDLTGGAANAQYSSRPTYRPSYRPDYSSYRPGAGRSLDHGSTRYERIDLLAVRLESEARELNHEVNAHYRSSPHYRVFEAQVNRIMRLADHIHEVAHHGGNLGHLREDVRQIDTLFHSAEHLFDEMTHFGRLDRETVIHVRRSLSRVENLIHSLRSDLY